MAPSRHTLAPYPRLLLEVDLPSAEQSDLLVWRWIAERPWGLLS